MEKKKTREAPEAEMRELEACLEEAGELYAAATEFAGLKGVEKALRESEALNRRLVEAAEEGMWVVDSNWLITFVNPKMTEILGHTAEELVGSPFPRFMAEGDAWGESDVSGRRPGGLTSHRFVRFQKKNGEIVWCRISVCPITDDEGKPCGAFGAVVDITEQRLLEDEVRQAQKMETVGALAGGIAHDFNNILAAIIGFSEMALDEIPPVHPARRSLQLVLKSGLRGRELVKQILAFSRRTIFERKPLLLTPLIKETVKLLRASLPANVEIALKADSRSSVVLADPTEVQQIVMNLCTNASHAMGGGGQLNITLSDRNVARNRAAFAGLPAGPYVQITVKDTGTGMDREVMKRIFEPFFTTKRESEGTGMGLSVVYGIVKSLNGHIAVKSAPGIGSSFHVYLPRLTEPVVRGPHAQKIRGGTERILFVDDEELLTEWGKDALTRLGYEVTAFTDSVDALKSIALDPFRFDLVVTDLAMPGITGLELAEECLKMRPDLPIILCTGHSDAVSPEIAKAAGIADFLMKPLSGGELAEAIRRAFKAKSPP